MTTEKARAHAVLQCRTCLTRWPVICDLLITPKRQCLELDLDLVNAWSRVHYGPVVLLEWHRAG